MQVFSDDDVRARTKRWEERVDKEFAEVVENLGYRGLYRRTIFDQKTRELCSISGLTTINAIRSLKTHILAALRAGATEAEVKEAIIQMATYCGMPRVGDALDRYEEVIKELKRQSPSPAK